MSVGTTWRDEGSGWLVRAGADSQTGGYRETNEDYVWLDSELPLALVFDGAGGASGGSLVARVAAGAIRDSVHAAHARGFDGPPNVLLEAALRAGHDAVVTWREEDAEHRGCGTTVVAAWVQAGSVHVTWLGDSRASVVSGGRVQLLTWDHDWRNEVARRQGVTVDEIARVHHRNVLLYYLGGWETGVRLEVLTVTPQPGDRLILATDGVTSVLDSETFLTACRTISDPTTCAEAIIEHALMAGSRDNCTCAVLAFERADEGPAITPPEPPRRWWRFWK